MKFKLDENRPREAAELLRKAGHDAADVVEEKLEGAGDDVVFGACQSEGRILVTLDLGFADLRAYPAEQSAGIIVLRLSRQSRAAVLDAMRRLTPFLEKEAPERRLWIVEDRRVRIRE